MKNIALIVAYDGAGFFGWQKTAAGASIEQTLESALQQILQEPLSLQAASRTDRGVHAEGQCVNFLTTKCLELKGLIQSLNRLLPPSIRILEAHFMPLTFHPTLHCNKKEYHFQICMGPFQLPHNRFYSWHVAFPIDLAKMEQAIPYFIGRHDFSHFCNQRKNMNYQDKIRQIEHLEMNQPTPLRLLIQIKGDHFLYKMVRNIVGTLIYIGRGKISLNDLPSLFLPQPEVKKAVTAPAHGLILKKIYYPTMKS